MRSRILRTTSEILHPVLLLFALHLVAAGHDQPGGGFAGGLVAAASYVLRSLAHGVDEGRRRLPASPRGLLGIGLGAALAAALLPLATGRPFFTALWAEIPVPWGGMLYVGTPYLFETGVLLVVSGVVLSVMYPLMRGR